MTTSNVVCFISAKGGSGKTVVSSALGTFLAALGFKVLLVDTDAATNGMTLLFLDQLLGRKRVSETTDKKRHGLFETGALDTPDALPIDENLHFVPASYTMRETEGMDLDAFGSAIHKVLQRRIDYNFIDEMNHERKRSMIITRTAMLSGFFLSLLGLISLTSFGTRFFKGLWPQINSDVLSNVGLSLALAGMLAAITFDIFKDLTSRRRGVGAAMVEAKAEREKLLVTVTATEALMSFGRGGYFSERRRAQAVSIPE